MGNDKNSLINYKHILILQISNVISMLVKKRDRKLGNFSGKIPGLVIVKGATGLMNIH